MVRTILWYKAGRAGNAPIPITSKSSAYHDESHGRADGMHNLWPVKGLRQPASEEPPSTRSARSRSIHSRTYAGQWTSSIPSSSQLIRNRTPPTSTSVTSLKSKIFVAQSPSISDRMFSIWSDRIRPHSRSLVTHPLASFSIFSISCSPRFADDRIPCRWLLARQIRQECLACGFVSLPFLGVRERGDRYELT